MDAVKGALEPLPGVAAVDVDFRNRLAHCKLESEKFDLDNALAALAGEGYDKAHVVEATN